MLSFEIVAAYSKHAALEPLRGLITTRQPCLLSVL